MANPFQGGGGFGGYRIPTGPRQSYSGLTNAPAMRAGAAGGGNPFTGQNAFTGGTSPALANGITPFATAAGGGTTPAGGGGVTTPNPYGYQTTGQGGQSTEVDFGSSPYNSWMGNFNQVDCARCQQVCGAGSGSDDSGGGGGGGGGGSTGPDDPGNPDTPGGKDKSIQKLINQKAKHCNNGNKKACHDLHQIRQQVHSGGLDKSASASSLGGGSSAAPAPAPSGGGGGGKKGGGGGGKGKKK